MKTNRITLGQDPSLAAEVRQLSDASWPTFLLHGDVEHWSDLYDRFAAYQVLLIDPADGLVAAGHSVPVAWDGSEEDLPETITEILERALRVHAGEAAATALAALAAMVPHDYRGRGLSAEVIRAMVALTERHRLDCLIAPVRPTEKSLYPFAPMEHYVDWKRADGTPFDPWIRVHWRLGAARMRIAPATLRVEGTVADWEKWTGKRFPESGSYAVPGALQPVAIDRSRDRGSYADPNVWMRHLAGATAQPAGRKGPF